MEQNSIGKQLTRVRRGLARRGRRLAVATPPGRRWQEQRVAAIVAETMYSPGRRATYYRATHVMTQLLDRAGIKYFAFAGTLLGSVRHQGLIPWDDDVDLMILESDAPRMGEVIAEVESYGIRRNLRHAHKDGVFQFLPFGDPIIAGNKGYLGIDIFVAAEVDVPGVGTVLHHKDEDFRRWFPKQWFRADEIFPRRRIPFGPLQLWGMGHPEPYLERSGFVLDEAIIRVHGGRKHLGKQAVSQLKRIGAYPIRTPQVLRMVAPWEPFDALELDAYRVGKRTADERATDRVIDKAQPGIGEQSAAG